MSEIKLNDAGLFRQRAYEEHGIPLTNNDSEILLKLARALPEAQAVAHVRQRDIDELQAAGTMHWPVLRGLGHHHTVPLYTAPEASADVVRALEEALELAKLAGTLTGCRSDDDYVWGLEKLFTDTLDSLKRQSATGKGAQDV